MGVQTKGTCISEQYLARKQKTDIFMAQMAHLGTKKKVLGTFTSKLLFYSSLPRRSQILYQYVDSHMWNAWLLFSSMSAQVV
jgi:hypothetical protein